MKTLLLTLVVLTIVCLDLGNTRICDDSSIPFLRTPQLCPKGQDVCYKKTPIVKKFKWLQKKGCASSCPKNGFIKIFKIECCTKDNCI
uniref:Three-finger toxin 10b n=1 Tax=Micrurus fulvius TaxID=8637 RepID=A0A0F7YZ34_MICFL